MEFSVTITGDKEAKQRLIKINQKLVPRMQRALKTIAIGLQSHIKRSKLSGSVLKRRTKLLSSSITQSVVRSAKELYARVGTDVVYAKIHEYGGTIYPKQAKYLWIPLNAAKTARGVVREPVRSYAERKDTFFRRSASGKLFLFQNMGDGIKPLFMATNKVVIPERSYMRTSLKEKKQFIINQIRKGLKEAIKK